MTFARVRALIVVAVLFIAAGVVVIMAIGRDTQTQAAAGGACAGGLGPGEIKMPGPRDQGTIKVLKGTTKAGLAQRVGEEFAHRGFKNNQKKSAPAHPRAN